MKSASIVAVLLTAFVFSACGGGDGKPKERKIDPPGPTAVSVGADTKQLIFSWSAVPSATYYRLMENPDGHSGFTQTGDDIPAGTLSVTKHIAVHMHDWVNALYMVQACNDVGCTNSTEVSATGLLLDSIGFFKASPGEHSSHFGKSVALSADGNTLAVGASGDSSSAKGVGGDPNDNSAVSSGAAYVFRLDKAGWRQSAYIKASNTEAHDGFGMTIALSADGNTLAVGAHREASDARGINGDQENNLSFSSGAVYLFRFADNVWSQEAYIKASNSDPYDRFSDSLALSADGNTLAVGMSLEDSSATGVNGDQMDNSINNPGAAYVFSFDGFQWTQAAYIKASNTGKDDRFGSNLALNNQGTILAVGATGEDSDATGVGGDQGDGDDDSAGSGAVYVFGFDSTGWLQQAYIKSTTQYKGTSQNWREGFGEEIELNGDGHVLAVGSWRVSAVYLLRFDGTGWHHDSYIESPDDLPLHFGRGVLLTDQGDILIANGNPVRVFGNDGANWTILSRTNWPELELLGCPMYGGPTAAISADGATYVNVGSGNRLGTSGIGSGRDYCQSDPIDISPDNSGIVFVF